MSDPSITIGRINVSLPSGFENRADIISRKVAENIATYPVTKNISIETLRLPVVQVSRNDSNEKIASNIARQFYSSLNEHE